MLAKAETVLVTRTKDRPLLLRRAMECIRAQSYPDWHHVIVNDGGDRRFIQDLVASFPGYEGRATLIHNCPNIGMEGASNVGLLLSESAYFAIHDDDDTWSPDFLARTVPIMRQHEASPKFGGVVTGVTVVHEEIEGDAIREVRREPFRPDMEFVGLSRLLPENQFPPISMLCRRSVIDLIGLFDSRKPVLGDWDFHLRVARHFDIVYLRDPLAFYHHRGAASGSLSNSVYADSGKHRFVRSQFFDAMLRERLRRSPDEIIDFLMAADSEQRLLNRMAALQAHNDWVSEQLGSIKQEIRDADWRQKSHFDWRHDQVRYTLDELLAHVKRLQADIDLLKLEKRDI